MADILLDNQSNAAAPASGQSVLMVNSTNKRLTVVSDANIADTVGGLTNASTANQTGFASDAYLSGSGIAIPPGLVRVGSTYRLRFDMTKTAAGTATPIIQVRFGTNGTTADSARLTFTFAAGTAAVDSGLVEILAHWRVAGSSAILAGVCRITHALAATGLTSTGASGTAMLTAVSSAFDATVANSIIGVSFNGGASFSGTNVVQQARLLTC